MPSFNSAWGLWHWEMQFLNTHDSVAQLGFFTWEKQFALTVSKKGKTTWRPCHLHKYLLVKSWNFPANEGAHIRQSNGGNPSDRHNTVTFETHCMCFLN